MARSALVSRWPAATPVHYRRRPSPPMTASRPDFGDHGRRVHRRGTTTSRQPAPRHGHDRHHQSDRAIDIADTDLSDSDNSSKVTFTFSEALVGFTPADISVVSGTV